MIRLPRVEIQFLKGYNLEELEKYLKDYPENTEHTLEFKRRYNYTNNGWVRRPNTGEDNV